MDAFFTTSNSESWPTDSVTDYILTDRDCGPLKVSFMSSLQVASPAHLLLPIPPLSYHLTPPREICKHWDDSGKLMKTDIIVEKQISTFFLSFTSTHYQNKETRLFKESSPCWVLLFTLGSGLAYNTMDLEILFCWLKFTCTSLGEVVFLSHSVQIFFRTIHSTEIFKTSF